jgi:hypothetical protein
MARPEQHLPKTLEEAVTELKRNPSQPLRLLLADVEVELRLVGGADHRDNAVEDVLAGIGPWKGESTEALVRAIREAREQDDPTSSARP